MIYARTSGLTFGSNPNSTESDLVLYGNVQILNPGGDEPNQDVVVSPPPENPRHWRAAFIEAIATAFPTFEIDYIVFQDFDVEKM